MTAHAGGPEGPLCITAKPAGAAGLAATDPHFGHFSIPESIGN